MLTTLPPLLFVIVARSPSKKMHVRGPSSREQPWWLFVIALSYVLILTFSSAAPTGRALQQSNPELSAVKNVHPEVYQNLTKARLRKRGDPDQYMTLTYPGERFTITKLHGNYYFNFIHPDGNNVKWARKWSELPKQTKAKYKFLQHPVSDADLQEHNIVLADDTSDFRHTYENPIMPKQKILVWKHQDGTLEFDYRFHDGTTKRVPSHQLPEPVKNYVEEIPQIGDLLRKTVGSSSGFRPPK
ncbi:hypothetical protein NDA13_000166 [Ustilago tritici]|nr:hypothetical protein NDA13_000166 [Ustilago tritici]